MRGKPRKTKCAEEKKKKRGVRPFGLGQFPVAGLMPVRCLRPPCTAVGGAKTSKSAPLVSLTLYSSFKQAKGGLGDRIEPLEPTGSDFSDLRDDNKILSSFFEYECICVCICVESTGR
ncbi:hypothetical protein E1A91_A02G047400v1 [Gossypium mustelinum]|uniref:Uncharacterized protein n=1 Tax=Gossypium mustelinum TaxID=34275 RepID=A0A5D3A5P6_GOSMU|nr:hypothetical protein E1A91_A02G047400v1 [Gossypium mustelinum]